MVGDNNTKRRMGPIFKYGIASGFALVLIGGVAQSLALTNVFLAMLVVCAGLGVILGAFGSTASVSIPVQGITLGGVAAIAVALFVVLLTQLDDRYVLVKVNGPVTAAEVNLVGDHDYLGAYREAQKSHDFVVFGKEIKSPILKLNIALDNEREYPFDCIDTKVLRPHLATGRTVSWTFELPTGASDTPKIFDTKSRDLIAGDVGTCRFQAAGEAVESVRNDQPPNGWLNSIFSPAFAQLNSASNPEQIKTHVEELESGISHVRRGARSKLAATGVAIVEPLMARLSEETNSYRTTLGIIVALTEMLRENKEYREDIIGKINAEDLERLVNAAAHEDRTIRIYASEFLYDLGDPRSIAPAFDRFPSASPNGRYNILLVIKGAVPFVSDDNKASVAEKVVALKSEQTPKTNKLIDSIVQLAN